MTVKENLLNLLEYNRGIYLSGESIAEQLNVTRAAVWKGINSLRKDGFVIDALTNKGYALSMDSDLLSESGIKKNLEENTNFKVELHHTVSSTNVMLRNRIHEDEGLVIAANEQTAGIGRMGRRFYSPQDTGIYFSLLLKPDMVSAEATLLTTMAAVGVCQAIEKVSDKSPKIKWVNDIYIDGKKVCGILTQASFSLENSRAEYVLLGIGINVYTPPVGFPKEIENIAGSVFDKSQGELKNRLLAEILNCFWKLYQGFDRKAVVEKYKSYNFVIGKEVLVVSPVASVKAIVMDIDSNCNLMVRYENGRQETLSSNEISLINHTGD